MAPGLFPLAATSRYCRGLVSLPDPATAPDDYADAILRETRKGYDAVLPLAERLALPARATQEQAVATLVLTEVRGEQLAVRVDRVAGQQQIYVKPVPELLGRVRALSGPR